MSTHSNNCATYTCPNSIEMFGRYCDECTTKSQDYMKQATERRDQIGSFTFQPQTDEERRTHMRVIRSRKGTGYYGV